MLLRLGMESPDVLNLEQVLQGLGFDGFTVDGKYDVHTENVIKYIQRTTLSVDGKKLDIDGVAGPDTLAVIDTLYEPLIENFARLTPEIEPLPDGTFPKGDEELKEVHPILARKVLQIIGLAAQEGYNLTVVQGLRTFNEQHRLFLQRPRVTKADAGQSYHNYGVAADLAFIVDGKISWNTRLYKNIGRWASQVGLTWGGTWHFVDYPHVQLLNMPAIGNLYRVYNQNGGGLPGVHFVWTLLVK